MQSIISGPSQVTRARTFVAYGNSLDVWLLRALIIAIPFSSASLFDIMGRPVRLEWIAGILLGTVFVARILSGKQKVVLQLSGRLMLVFIGIALLGLANLIDAPSVRVESFLTLFTLAILGMMVYLAIGNSRLSQRQVRSLMRLWVGLAVLLALYGIFESMIRTLGFPLPKIYELSGSVGLGRPESDSIAGFFRASSVFAEPSSFGIYLVVASMIGSYYPIRFSNGGLLRVLSSRPSILIILTAGIIVSFSLSAYITLALVLVFGQLLWRSRGYLPFILVFSVVGLGLLVNFVLNEGSGVPFLEIVESRTRAGLAETLGNGAFQIDQDALVVGTSASERMDAARRAFNVWIDRPITGVGLNQLTYRLEVDHVGKEVPVNNAYLQLLVDVGVVGFVAIAAIWSLMLIRLRRGGKSGLRSAPFIAFHMVLLADIIALNFTFTWVEVQVWLHLGFALLLTRVSETDQV